nr:MAG TPA: hypothetical protein [Caudoviricetes sp.]
MAYSSNSLCTAYPPLTPKHTPIHTNLQSRKGEST